MEGSFLEDSGAHARNDAAAGSDDAGNAVLGRGDSADGMVRVTVTEQGRVDHVDLSPDLLRPGADGAYAEPDAIGAGIATAVNAALDDLAVELRSGSDGFDELEAKLDAVTAGFENALGKVADDLAKAQKRLEES
ncbi:YbaB/EbfC family nucleoid-associated protein [Parasphingorhabdus pacifica]